MPRPNAPPCAPRATRHCAAIRAENEKRAQDEYWKLVREGVKDTEQRVQRLDRTARLEAKKSILDMKQEAVSRAFDLAKEQDSRAAGARLHRLPRPRGRRGRHNRPGGGHLLRAGQGAVGAKAVRAANELLAARGVPATLTLADATREMAGGLILKQGDIEVNCTVDTLLDLTRGELAARVARGAL